MPNSAVRAVDFEEGDVGVVADLDEVVEAARRRVVPRRFRDLHHEVALGGRELHLELVGRLLVGEGGVQERGNERGVDAGVVLGRALVLVLAELRLVAVGVGRHHAESLFGRAEPRALARCCARAIGVRGHDALAVLGRALSRGCAHVRLRAVGARPDHAAARFRRADPGAEPLLLAGGVCLALCGELPFAVLSTLTGRKKQERRRDQKRSAKTCCHGTLPC